MSSIRKEMLSNDKTGIAKVESLWTIYRKLVVDFVVYVQEKRKEKAFKIFFSRSIPEKYWDFDIEIWLRELEHGDIVNMNRLEILSSFLKLFDDSEQMLSKISEFQRLLDLVEIILNYGSKTSEDAWIYDPPIKIEKLKISEELHALIKQWEEEIKNTPNISKEWITEMYSKATQILIKIASESNKNDHSRSLEAIFIAQFLIKIEGMSESLIWQ